MNFRRMLQILQLGSLDTRFDVLDRERQLKYLHCTPYCKSIIRNLLKEQKQGNVTLNDISGYIDYCYDNRRNITHYTQWKSSIS